jgi:hypothetical protein
VGGNPWTATGGSYPSSDWSCGRQPPPRNVRPCDVQM